MVSRSYSNLLELASGESPSFERMNRRIPRIMTVAGIMSDIDDDPSESVCSDPSSSSGQMYRIIIVANQLPIRAQRKSDGSKSWIFSWDENSLLKQLKDGLGDDEIEVIYVGCLKEEVHLSEQEEVSQILLETFKCVPTFLPPDLFSRIMEVINPEDDFVWVHDYHLMVLPTFLRKRCNKVKLGFFLHSPFPSSEIYKTLPIREELLRALLNSDFNLGSITLTMQDISCLVAVECLVFPMNPREGTWALSTVVGLRQGNDQLNKLLGQEPSTPKKSMLVISEFIGCSPSLSGAIRVNPWNIDAVADAMDYALEMADPEKQLRHEKHYRYVSTHDVGYWARSFFQDLERTCRNHSRRRCWGIGFGLSFRVVALDPNFKKLSMERIVSAYKRTTTRAILLDYDGTLMPQASIDKSPSSNSIGIINSLCRDKNNMVFLVSARSRKKVAEWFSQCVRLGLAAEHGYFLRLMRDAEWETCVPVADTTWKQIAEPVMQLYTETTDGSTVEDKKFYGSGWLNLQLNLLTSFGTAGGSDNNEKKPLSMHSINTSHSALNFGPILD
ncbi:hypothetical protein D5086_016643 [Populus alba]|uniref:Uncharacterized protein n=1 Tax=Populus alba TaxID=43335 RepID=A0ACC4BV91_POPAL